MPSGDDGVVDPRAHPNAGADDRGEPGSFDPGGETAYVRRSPRDYELSPELGAAPFDPGSAGYDQRRARREAKRRARLERRLLQRAERVERKVAVPPPGAAGHALAAAPQVEVQPEPVQPEPVPEPAREPIRAESEPAPVVELRPAGRPRESMAERLERQRIARERAEAERRARIEHERAAREQADRERRAQRHRARAQKPRPSESQRPARAKVHPGVKGPVRKRARAAENRRRAATRRHGLFWPTAKAGFAVSVVLALSAALGSLAGLPVPWVESGSAGQSLANSASIFGIDPGTPTGLVRGYVFPILGPHDFGDKIDRFGAPRYGHTHEGQDIFAKTGTPEVAVHDGIVVDRGKATDPDDGGRGNYVVLYSQPDNHSFVYMHMLKPSPVMLGDRVHSGEVVGQLGCTGSCDGPHLHFEVRIGKASLGADTKPVDPLPFLKQWPQSTPG